MASLPFAPKISLFVLKLYIRIKRRRPGRTELIGEMVIPIVRVQIVGVMLALVL